MGRHRRFDSGLGRPAAEPECERAESPGAARRPTQAFDLTFQAEAGRGYRLWLRGKALSNSYSNDSVFVQFAGSVDAAGVPTWRIDSTDGSTVILEDCSGCGLSGWGWADNGYGTNVLGPLVYFAATGPQRLRVQMREDGLGIDQVVLSAVRYLQTPPGAAKNDTTILEATPIVVGPPSNAAPSVSLTAPPEGPPPVAPATITLRAAASDPDGTITAVEFYAGLNLLARVTDSPFTATWTDVAAGTYSLTARAIDDGGATTTSASVLFSVAAPPPPPPPAGAPVDEIVLYAAVDAQVLGGWTVVADATAAAGLRLQNPNAAEGVQRLGHAGRRVRPHLHGGCREALPPLAARQGPGRQLQQRLGLRAVRRERGCGWHATVADGDNILHHGDSRGVRAGLRPPGMGLGRQRLRHERARTRRVLCGDRPAACEGSRCARTAWPSIRSCSRPSPMSRRRPDAPEAIPSSSRGRPGRPGRPRDCSRLAAGCDQPPQRPRQAIQRQADGADLHGAGQVRVGSVARRRRCARRGTDSLRRSGFCSAQCQPASQAMLAGGDAYGWAECAAPAQYALAPLTHATFHIATWTSGLTPAATRRRVQKAAQPRPAFPAAPALPFGEVLGRVECRHGSILGGGVAGASSAYADCSSWRVRLK